MILRRTNAQEVPLSKQPLDRVALLTLKLLLREYAVAEAALHARLYPEQAGKRFQAFSVGDPRLAQSCIANEEFYETRAIKRLLKSIQERGVQELLARYWAAKTGESENWRAYLLTARRDKKNVAPVAHLAEKRGSHVLNEVIEAALADAA